MFSTCPTLSQIRSWQQVLVLMCWLFFRCPTIALFHCFLITILLLLLLHNLPQWQTKSCQSQWAIANSAKQPENDYRCSALTRIQQGREDRSVLVDSCCCIRFPTMVEYTNYEFWWRLLSCYSSTSWQCKKSVSTGQTSLSNELKYVASWLLFSQDIVSHIAPK